MIEILGYNRFLNRDSYLGGSSETETFHIYYKDVHDHCFYKCVLTNSLGDCPSGWTTASWGNKEIVKFGPFYNVGTLHFKPIKKIEIDSIEDFIDIDIDGGDSWYPCGYANIIEDYKKLFKKTKRFKEKRQVYIFTGESGIGKSYIAKLTGEANFFETDKYGEHIPEEIIQNVIVLGNKFKNITIEKVKKAVKDAEITVVEFKKDNK